MLLQFPGPSRHYKLHLIFSVVDTAVVAPQPSFLVHDKFPWCPVSSSFDALSLSVLIPKSSVELGQAMLPAFVTSFHLTGREYQCDICVMF